MGSYVEPLRVPQEGQTVKQSKISHQKKKKLDPQRFLGKLPLLPLFDSLLKINSEF